MYTYRPECLWEDTEKGLERNPFKTFIEVPSRVELLYTVLQTVT